MSFRARAEQTKQFRLIDQRLDALEAGGGGGGGGPASWGAITGTLSAQTDLQTALNGKAATVHTHIIANVTGLQTALDGKAATTHGHLIADVTGLQTALDGKADAGAMLSGVATVTVPNNSLEWSQTVAATGVTPSSIIVPQIAPHSDADENDAELLDIAAVSAAPGTDQITFTLAFASRAAGPVKLAWRA